MSDSDTSDAEHSASSSDCAVEDASSGSSEDAAEARAATSAKKTTKPASAQSKTKSRPKVKPKAKPISKSEPEPEPEPEAEPKKKPPRAKTTKTIIRPPPPKPVRGRDVIGTFYRSGRTGKKCYYTPKDYDSRTAAYEKAQRRSGYD